MLDLLGAIGTTISLVTKIKTRFDKVGQNKHECALLSSDAINSLLKIKEFLERPASCPSQELRNCLSEFEIELNNINASLRSMIKPEKMCILGTSMTKIKDLYNADDVQHELVTLRQKVEACHRHLHMWSTVRTESKITDLHKDIVAGLEEQKASMRELRNELRMLIPGLTPTREAALERIQDEVSERHSMREDVCPSQLELLPVQSRISSQPVGSIRSARFSHRSFSSSFVEKSYLIRRIKEISDTLPKARNHSFRPSTITWFNQFRELENITAYMNREDAILEALRILKILRSGRRISYIDAVKDLLRLGATLRALAMPKQASTLYEWGVQLCCELAARGGQKIKTELVQFLNRLALSLNDDEQLDDAQWVLDQALRVVYQLAERPQSVYLATLAPSFGTLLDSLIRAERISACCEVGRDIALIHGDLAKVDPEVHVPKLGESLYHLGTHFSKAGKYEEAVEAVKEAIKWQKALVQRDYRTYLPALGISFHDMAVYLGHTGRSGEVVMAEEEAVRIWRQLIENDGSTRIPDHAILSDMAITETGRIEDAVALADEVVEMRQEFVRNHGEKTYIKNLGSSLYYMAIHLHQTGKLEHAVKTGEEAIAIRKRLVSQDRKTHLSDFGDSLHNTAVYYHQIGRSEDAVRVVEEAIKMRRELVNENRKDYLLGLGNSLYSMVTYLKAVGRLEDAVRAGEEAVEIRRELVQQNRKTHLPSFGIALHYVASLLHRVKRFSHAVKIGIEAIAVWRELVQQDGGIYLPQLSDSLYHVAGYLNCEGKSDEAVIMAGETIAIRRELAEHDRNAHLRGLAESLNNMAIFLDKTSRTEEAVNAVEEVITLGQELTVKSQHTYLPGLDNLLYKLAAYLHRTGRLEDAIRLGVEAIVIRRELVTRDRDTHLARLISSLCMVAQYLDEAGKTEETVIIVAEIITLRQELIQNGREDHFSDLDILLCDVAVYLYETGRPEDAVRVGEEAVMLQKKLVENDGEAYLSNFIQTSQHLVVFLKSLERNDEASIIEENILKLSGHPHCTPQKCCP